jgi:hypothetical protein
LQLRPNQEKQKPSIEPGMDIPVEQIAEMDKTGGDRNCITPN